MAEGKRKPPPLTDKITEVYTAFSYPCEIYADQELALLVPRELRAYIHFDVSDHISSVHVDIAEDAQALPDGAFSIHKFAKMKFPAKGTTFEVSKVTKEELCGIGVWDEEHADKKFNYTTDRRFLYSMRMMVSVETASFENILVNNAGPYQQLRDYLVSGRNDLFLVLRGGDKVLEDVDQLLTKFEEDRKVDSLKKWYPRTRRFQVQIGQSLRVDDHPVYTLRPSYSFFPCGIGNVNDYLTQMAFGRIQEQEYNDRRFAPTEWKTGRAVLMKSVGLGDRAFFICLSPPKEDEAVRYQAGDILDVNFDRETEDVRQVWKARIQEPLPFTPYGYSTAVVTRPWDKMTRTYTDVTGNHEALTLEQLGEDTVRAIESHAGVEIMWQYNASDKIFKRQIAAVERLFKLHQRYEKNDQKFEATTTQLNDMLVFLNNSPVTLPLVDLYADVVDVTDMKVLLESEQMEAFELCRKAPGGWVLVQGPPGTGKTYFAMQVCRPFLAAEGHFPILCTSATNAGVDDMARKGNAILKELKSDKYVLRLHAITTERSAALRQGLKNRAMPVNAKPRVFQDPPREDLETVETVQAVRVLYNRYLKSKQQLHDGIRDARFIELELSLGYRVLQVLGYAPGGDALLPFRFTVNDEGKKHDAYGAFVEAYQQWDADEQFDEQRMTDFRELLAKLQSDLIANCAMVVTTVAAAATAVVYTSVQPYIIVIDEAARASEIDLLPLSAHYPTVVGKVMVGDIYQLRPVCRSIVIPRADPGRNFAAQQTLSLMHRLQKSGFPVTVLKTQFRAIPDIAQIYSKVVYRGQLRNAGTTIDRPLTEALKEFNGREFDRQSPVIFFDLLNSMAHSNDTGSQYNIINCAFALELIDKLFKEPFMNDENMGAMGRPRVAILGCYQAQYLLYAAAKDGMELMKTPWLDRLTVDKVDRRQGEEWDFVVIDLTITDRVGFLREVNRLNVLWSRARCGLYVIGSKAQMDSIVDRGVGYLRNFYGECLRFRVVNDAGSTTSRFVDFDTVRVDQEGGMAECVDAQAELGEEHDKDNLLNTGDWSQTNLQETEGDEDEDWLNGPGVAAGRPEGW